ncbi:MAG TPA: hypothetical protein VN679_04335 [Candidatus Acidoferrales bacterium]|nr:hypothetical protein [Candidatus Acidoferrales bacterium]
MTTRERFDHTVTLMSGMIIGATAMYIFDANRGARRRAYARDRLIHAGHRMGRGLRKRSRDWVNRALGAVAELRSSIKDRIAAVPDDQLGPGAFTARTCSLTFRTIAGGGQRWMRAGERARPGAGSGENPAANF